MTKFSKIEKLTSLGTAALGSSAIALDTPVALFGDALTHLLEKKNGFLAFESALHVYPRDDTDDFDITVWNLPSSWKRLFLNEKEIGFCFAQDLFSRQFFIKANGVFVFDPDDASIARSARDLEDWAGLALLDYSNMFGWRLAHDWQETFGPLAYGERLAPKVPFVLGGDFSIDNLYKGNALNLLGARANIANQILSLPDGAEIAIKIVD
jgi:hypothetical protein